METSIPETLATNHRKPNSNSLTQINNKTRKYFSSLSWREKPRHRVGLGKTEIHFIIWFSAIVLTQVFSVDFRLPPPMVQNIIAASVQDYTSIFQEYSITCWQAQVLRSLRLRIAESVTTFCWIALIYSRLLPESEGSFSPKKSHMERHSGYWEEKNRGKGMVRRKIKCPPQWCSRVIWRLVFEDMYSSNISS